MRTCTCTYVTLLYEKDYHIGTTNTMVAVVEDKMLHYTTNILWYSKYTPVA